MASLVTSARVYPDGMLFARATVNPRRPGYVEIELDPTNVLGCSALLTVDELEHVAAFFREAALNAEAV